MSKKHLCNKMTSNRASTGLPGARGRQSYAGWVNCVCPLQRGVAKTPCAAAPSIFLAMFCLVAVFILSGCGGIISRSEPLQVITLSPYKAGAPLCGEAFPVQISVPVPYASAGLNTDRIVLLLNDREVHYLAGYKWDDITANLVQRMLVDSMNDSNCFRGVGTGGMSLRAGYRLEVDIKRMHFISGGKNERPRAEVSLILSLIETDTGLMVGRYNAYANRRCGEDIYVSMEESVHAVLWDVMDWLRETLATALQS